MFRTIITAAILTLTLATTAQADQAVTVRFGDLNLSNPADTRVLNSRIENAAEAACASLKAPSMFYKTWHARCVSNATARVSAQIASLSSGKYRTFASK